MVVRGVKMHDHLNKWHLSAILDEELTNFTFVVDSDEMTDLQYAMPSILEKINQGQLTTTNIDTVSFVRSAIFLCLIFAVCSTEEK